MPASKHFWFIELGEPLPFQAGQRLLRYGELTQALARRGHRVTWWACDFSHQTRSFIGEPDSRVRVAGVDIVLVHGPGYRRNVGLRRLRHIAYHAKRLGELVHDQPIPDVIVSAMPTIEACAVAASYAASRNVALVVDIRDEWPEDYVRWLPAPLRPFGRAVLGSKFTQLAAVCRQATALTAVTGRQLEYGLRYAGRPAGAKDRVFHTGARRTRLDPAVVNEHILKWRALGIRQSDFVVVFTGTMSQGRPLTATIEAARQLAGQIPLKLVIAGGGDLESRYRGQAAGCDAVLFPGWVSLPDMAALNALANALLAPYSPEYGFSLPTKIFDYMAAGRALISSCPGEAEELVRGQGIGIQVRVNDADDIAAAMLRLYHDPALARDMGARARELFEQRFALEAIVEHYAEYLESAS